MVAPVTPDAAGASDPPAAVLGGGAALVPPPVEGAGVEPPLQAETIMTAATGNAMNRGNLAIGLLLLLPWSRPRRSGPPKARKDRLIGTCTHSGCLIPAAPGSWSTPLGSSPMEVPTHGALGRVAGARQQVAARVAV